MNLKHWIVVVLLAFVSFASPSLARAEGADEVKTPTGAAGEPAAIPLGTKMKCPVSGEDFTVKAKTVQVIYKGKRYAFCCPDCIGDFKKNPAKFAK